MDKNVSKEEARRAFKEVSKERQEENVKALKTVVRQTLTTIDRLQEERDTLNKRISILKKDVEDLKEGRLDRIEERQQSDPDAAKVSVVKVERVIEKTVEHHHHHDYPYPVVPYVGDFWRQPWRFTWNDTYIADTNAVQFDSMGTVIPTGNSGAVDIFGTTFELNASVCADNAAGTYKLDHGKVKSF